MQTVLLIIHLLIVISLVVVVLLQQSSVGGLGFGGDKDFMSARGVKTAMTRLTAILAAIFFVSSLVLTITSNVVNSPRDVLQHISKSAPSVPISQSIHIDTSKAHNNKPIPITIPDSVLESIKKDQAKKNKK